MGISTKAAAQLKALRIHNKLTVPEFAERAGVQRQRVNTYERGVTNLTMRVFDAMCESLGVDPEKLMCGSAKIPLPSKPGKESSAD